MDEIVEVGQTIMASIVRQAQLVAPLPPEVDEAAYVAVREAHLEAVLELGHSLKVAEGLADSALKWTRTAVEIIRVRGSLEAGVPH